MKKYDLAADFSRAPFGRYRDDGKHNGETFREQYLYKWLKQGIEQNELIEIDLDGVPLGIGSSFLEESFGGLVRKGLLGKEDVIRTLRIKSDEDPSYIDEIIEYITDAKPERSTAMHE